MSTAEEALSVNAQVSEEEWQTRVNLAACYRLIYAGLHELRHFYRLSQRDKISHIHAQSYAQ